MLVTTSSDHCEGVGVERNGGGHIVKIANHRAFSEGKARGVGKVGAVVHDRYAPTRKARRLSNARADMSGAKHDEPRLAAEWLD